MRKGQSSRVQLLCQPGGIEHLVRDHGEGGGANIFWYDFHNVMCEKEN